MPERQYEAVGACTWVEFDPADDVPWAGVFGHHGMSAHSGVFNFADDQLAFVIASGVGWIVDVDTGDLKLKTDQECLVTATAFDNMPFIAAADWTNIYIYSTDKLVWLSDRIALDGIRFEKAHNGTIKGRCWQPDGWYAFHIQTDPWQVVRDGFITSE